MAELQQSYRKSMQLPEDHKERRSWNLTDKDSGMNKHLSNVICKMGKGVLGAVQCAYLVYKHEFPFQYFGRTLPRWSWRLASLRLWSTPRM